MAPPTRYAPGSLGATTGSGSGHGATSLVRSPGSAMCPRRLKATASSWTSPTRTASRCSSPASWPPGSACARSPRQPTRSRTCTSTSTSKMAPRTARRFEEHRAPMHPDGGRDFGGGPGVLISALAWRARRGGLRSLLVGFVPFVVALGLTVVPATLGGPVNGAGTFARFAPSYAAHADGVGLGVVLLLLPGVIALCSAIAVGVVVRNLIGSEASRGGIEALLGGPYRSASIMIALLG